MARRKKKEPARFPMRMRRKLAVVFGLFAVLLMGLIVKIMYIDVKLGEKYEKVVLSQQKYDSTTIPYQRGDILDANGNVLATSMDVYNVILDCKVLTSKEENIEPTIEALTECFDELSETELRQLIEKKPNSQYNKLLKKQPYKKVKKFVEMMNDTEKYPNIKGVWMEKEYIRNYPYDNVAAGVIGYISGENNGVLGLEAYYNETLNGANGREYGYVNDDNNFQKTVKDAVNGDNIITTIDINIQSVVEEKMAAFVEEYRDNAHDGAGCENMGIIVMDPNNGEVLAMADYPGYNLNEPRDLSAYYTEEELEALTEEEKLEILYDIWENYCVSHTYEPGSTVKPLTVATGLETGTLTGDETYECDGYEMVGGHKIHCVNRDGHGTLDIDQTLMESCNDGLMQMSYAIGKDNLITYQRIFGFGQKTNIDLPSEARTDSLVYTLENMDDSSLATNSFGQNFNVTMVELVSAFSSLVNGGYYYQPHMVKKITDENGNLIETKGATLLRQTVSAETCEEVKEAMEKTVTEGTAMTAKVKGYSMGGKTGTAEKLPRGSGNYVVSYIGYAPADNPQVVIYVVIDEPNVEDQAHSSYAQAVSRDIMTEILPYMNIFPDEE